ncbi:MarR family winged helix-turn-helix transcriptional regulator [Pseudochrobactrum sp. HB0163]|uniref:MarR family winged helix-turn-helix transcriptional regulator n=1 Tax=Pseudochrobactrum sp. HB0163 TaxID=3450708 RepID=UPI003F6E38C5
MDNKYTALLSHAERNDLNPQDLRLCFELLSTSRQIDLSCAAKLSPYQLSESRFVILFLLREEKTGLPPCLLAQRAGISRATLTGLLDGLERDGFILRNPVQEDRRSILITLTNKGADIASALTDQHMRWIASLMKPLNAQEKLTLSALLTKIRITAKASADHDKASG